jgi:hypothetical protein
MDKEIKYLSENEAALLLCCSVQTLRNQRHKGKGLPYRKFGRCVRYRLDEVLTFMEQRKITPEN